MGGIPRNATIKTTLIKGDLNEGKTCLEVQRYVCEMIENPKICKEVPMEPLEVCQPTFCPETSKCNANETEICTVSGITEISQECAEKCHMEKASICENKEFEVGFVIHAFLYTRH